MTKIIDKRFLPKNGTAGSRQKFIDRYKGAIKKRIREIVEKGSIKDFGKGEKKVKITKDDLAEPSFGFQSGTGKTERIYIGNKQFHKGQKVKRPPQQGGKGSGAGNGGEGEDDFEFVLTDKEYSDLFFEDLELPDLTKKELLGSCFEIKHAGFSRYGGPSSLNIKKTMLNALGRRAALKRKLEKVKEEQKEIITDLLEPRKGKQQFIEDIDLRYNFKDRVDVPASKAVMFLLMDVSGSMGEKEKDLAKRFFILLNMFLRRTYTIVDVVFVRHTEHADEVDEDTFFHDRHSGGTIISSGYEKINEIKNQRYGNGQWNMYLAQASDGENWPEDMEHMEDVLVKKILPELQYMAYIDLQVRSGRGRLDSDVGKIMSRLMQSNKNLQARVVCDYPDIFPVFRSLFKKKEGK